MSFDKEKINLVIFTQKIEFILNKIDQDWLGLIIVEILKKLKNHFGIENLQKRSKSALFGASTSFHVWFP